MKTSQWCRAVENRCVLRARLKALSDRSGDCSTGGRRFRVAGPLTATLRCPVAVRTRATWTPWNGEVTRRNEPLNRLSHHTQSRHNVVKRTHATAKHENMQRYFQTRQLTRCSNAHTEVSIKPGTHWRQSRKDVQHSGNKFDRVGDIVDGDKLSNSSSCRFVAKTGNKVTVLATKSTVSATVDFVADLSPVSATVDFRQSRLCWIQLYRQCVPGLMCRVGR